MTISKEAGIHNAQGIFNMSNEGTVEALNAFYVREFGAFIPPKKTEASASKPEPTRPKDIDAERLNIFYNEMR